MQSAPVFTVPILHMDVQESDCIEDMLNALRQLDSVQTKLFSGIEQRLETERKKYNDLVARIDKAKKNVDAISNLRGGRATTLFSSARFPVATIKNRVQYRPVHEGKEDYERKTGFEEFGV